MNESRLRLSSLIRSSHGLLALVLSAVALSAIDPSTVWAQADSTDAIAKATQLNKDAIAAYQNHKTDDAKRLLKQALDLCDASGLSQHPVKARTLIHFGIVLIGGNKQRELGIRQFRKALEIQPEIALTKVLVTPELQQAFDDAKKGDAKAEAKPEAKPEAKSDTKSDTKADTRTEAKSDTKADTKPEAKSDGAGDETADEAPAAAPPAAEAPSPSGTAQGEPSVPATGLDHEPVTRAKPGTGIPITVNVDPGLKFEKIVLAYRPNGASDYLGREMKQVDPGIYSAEIPPRATTGTLVAYYIEAQDKNGDPVAARGSADKPLAIMLGEPRVAKKTARRGDDQQGEGGEGDDDDDDDDDENGSKFFIGVQFGSGAGWASGNGDNDTATRYSSGGIAAAQAVHIAPELGYWVRPDLMLSVQARYQVVTGTTEYIDAAGHVHAGINYAFAAFAKATWMLGHGSLRPLFSLALGGGNIRHVVKNAMLHDCGANQRTDCIDTIAGGPVLAGAGAGLMYVLTPRVALLAVANSQIGAPNFTVNLDVNLGVAYQF
jgi:hypothetical protein